MPSQIYPILGSLNRDLIARAVRTVYVLYGVLHQPSTTQPPTIFRPRHLCLNRLIQQYSTLPELILPSVLTFLTNRGFLLEYN